MPRIEPYIWYLLLLLLPTQLGKHFWPDFSYVSGIRIDYLSPTLYTTDILILGLFICVFIRILKTRYNTKKNDKQFKILFTNKKFVVSIFIILFFLINIFYSNRPILSAYGLLKYCELAFLAFYVAKTIRTYPQVEKIAFLFGISSFFESLLAIGQYINQGSLNGFFYFFGERTFTGSTPGIANADINGALVLRPYATFPHPNVLAGYLLIAIVLIWSYMLNCKNRYMKYFGIVVLVINSIALLLTFSRVVILLWALLLLIVLGRIVLPTLKTGKAKITASISVFIGVIIISIFPLTQSVINRFSQLSVTDESVTERATLLEASWKMITMHPFIGVGLYNFIPSLAPLQKPMPLALYLQPVHSIFILFGSETGVIGLGLLIWFLVKTGVRINTQAKKSKGTIAVLFFIILITGSFDHYWLTLQQGQLLFAMVIGLCWSSFVARD